MDKVKKLSELGEALVDTLKSVHGTGSEIYAGGKAFGIKAIDIAQQQLPDMVNQILIWKLMQNIFIFIISVGIIIISIWLGKKFNKVSDGSIWVPMGILVAAAIGFAICSSLEILKITLAPEIYLIEYATNLIKIIN